MKLLFWFSAVFIAYSYAGYFCWLWLRAKWQPRPWLRGQNQASASVVMVVRNEEALLPGKLQNLLEFAGQTQPCQIIVVSDGSTDGTESVLREYGRKARVQAICNPVSRGKAAAINDGMRCARGEIILFTDVRQTLEKDAISRLLENFADPEIGVVSGELMLGDASEGETSRGMGLYWRMEKRMREMEAASSSVIGATGAIYAVRRKLVPELPVGTILDDLFIPMNVIRNGHRVVFDGRARAWDSPDLGPDREFRRKVRTLTGNYQLLQRAPWLLSGQNPCRFEFISHKLTRLAVPLALIALAISSLVVPEPLYRFAFWMQVVFYALGLVGMLKWSLGPASAFCNAAYTFVVLNAAAAMALTNFLTGNTNVWLQQPAVGERMKA